MNVMEIREFDPVDIWGPFNDVEKRRAPKRIFVAGDDSLLRVQPRVSIVGSRKASQGGLKRASKLAKLLVERGAIVISGLAEGIDTAAHRGALESGGRTVAVLGTPLDQNYPKSNAALQREIISHHVAVSQFPVGYPIQPGNFPMRNLVMALISNATVIAEAGETSGSLNQGWEALRLGRLLFIMESVVNNHTLSWPAKMISYGAQILSDETIDLFLDGLPTASVNDCAITLAS